MSGRGEGESGCGRVAVGLERVSVDVGERDGRQLTVLLLREARVQVRVRVRG